MEFSIKYIDTIAETWLCLGKDGESIGRIVFKIKKNIVTVQTFVINEKYKGKGYGLTLITKFISIIKNTEKIDTIYLKAFEEITNYNKLFDYYTKLGFEQYGKISYTTNNMIDYRVIPMKLVL